MSHAPRGGGGGHNTPPPQPPDPPKAAPAQPQTPPPPQTPPKAAPAAEPPKEKKGGSAAVDLLKKIGKGMMKVGEFAMAAEGFHQAMGATAGHIAQTVAHITKGHAERARRSGAESRDLIREAIWVLRQVDENAADRMEAFWILRDQRAKKPYTPPPGQSTHYRAGDELDFVAAMVRICEKFGEKVDERTAEVQRLANMPPFMFDTYIHAQVDDAGTQMKDSMTETLHAVDNGGANFLNDIRELFGAERIERKEK